MANLSRTEKYKELRDSLQHENTSSDTTVITPELKEFTKRVKEFDKSFQAENEEEVQQYDATHARREIPVETLTKDIEPAKKEKPAFDLSDYNRNENDTALPDNDYLDDVIREVKQYNIDQGNAVSENTSVNVFSQINENRRQTQPQQPLKPYPQPTKENDTADILPFMSPFREYDDDDDTNTEKILTEDIPEEHLSSSETMSKEDIMAEVQNLVNGKPAKRKSNYDQELLNSIDDDRTTRQKLLNETSHMRAQLDGYEDNLSEVNDKMRYTNRILNLVLIVLIIVLVVILFVMIYWVVLSRGA